MLFYASPTLVLHDSTPRRQYSLARPADPNQIKRFRRPHTPTLLPLSTGARRRARACKQLTRVSHLMIEGLLHRGVGVCFGSHGRRALGGHGGGEREEGVAHDGVPLHEHPLVHGGRVHLLGSGVGHHHRRGDGARQGHQEHGDENRPRGKLGSLRIERAKSQRNETRKYATNDTFAKATSSTYADICAYQDARTRHRLFATVFDANSNVQLYIAMRI